MEQILITRANSTVELINSSSTVTSIISAEHRKAALGEDVVVMSIEMAIDRAFSIGDSIKLFDGNTYKINQLPSVEKISERQFRYDLVFEGIQYDLLRVLYKNEDVSTFSTSAEFALTGDIEMFLNVLINNANRVFGANKWMLGSFPTNTETKNLLFSNENCLTVLQRICEEYSYEFTFTETSTQKILNVKNIGSELDFTFEYGKGKGLYNLKRDSVDSKKIVNKLFAYGSTKNIPSNYKNYSERLHFGTVSPFVDSVVSDATSISNFGVCEGSIIFDDVFPTGYNSITAINTSNRLEFTDSSMSFDLNAKDGLGNTLYLIPSVSAKVHFNTGNLAGYEFEVVKYTHSTKKFILKPVIDDKGFSIPSLTESAFYLSVGDNYSLLDIVMPQSLIDAAESLLESKAVDYLNANKAPIVKYSVAIDEVYLNDKTSNLNVFDVGDSVIIKDSDFNINTRIKIISFSRNVLYPYRYSIVVSDVPEIGVLRTLATKSNEADRIIRHNGFNDPTKFKQDPNSNNQIQSQIDETINRKPSVLIGRDSTNITIGNKENQTLTEILGQFGIRNTNNFLGQLSVAELTGNRIATLPDRDIEINKWADLSGVPTSFNPSNHFHQIGDVVGLSDALAGKQPLNANLTSLGLINANGIVRRTGVNTFVIGTNDPITLSGDVTGTGTTAITTTLSPTGVDAGTYRSVTVDAKGRVTAATNPTTIAGYGITDFDANWNTRWNVVKSAYINFGGSIEIDQSLTVSQDLYVSGKLFDSGLESGSASGKQVLRSTNTGFVWTTLDKSFISDFSTGILAQTLTGLTAGSNTPITAGNTILSAFQNTQAQINANATSITGLQTQITTNAGKISGTLNYLAKFGTTSSVANSLVFDNGTDVGIGEDSPNSILHIKSQAFQYWNGTAFSAAPKAALTIENSANGGYDSVLMFKQKTSTGNTKSSAAIGVVGIDNWADSNISSQISALYFLTRNTNDGYSEAMRINHLQNVGIGTTSPTYRLDVNGTGRFTGQVQFDSIPTCSVAPTAANHLVNLAHFNSAVFLKRGDTVKTISFTSLTKTGLYTVNGYTLQEGDHVLDASNNNMSGVWIASAGVWIRSLTNDTDSEIRGAYHLITQGTYANSRYINTNTSMIIIDVTAVTYDVDFGAETDPVWTAYKTANDLTPTRFGNWNTAFSWGNHTNLYVDKVSAQSDIAGAKKFTTSIQSPVVKGGTDSLGISIFNHFGTAPRIGSSGTMDFFATTDYTWYTTGDFGRMRLTASGLRVGSSSAPNFTLQVSGTTGLGGLLSVVSPFTGVYSSGTDGQFLQRKSVAGLNYNQWASLLVADISDIATYYQAKITGTTNYLTKKTASNFGDSQIFDDGTFLAIGGTTAIDGSKFSVVGKIGANTARIGDDTNGINIGALAINSTGALNYGATSHVWNVSSTEKMNLNDSRLALTGNFELTGKLKVNGSFGIDHYFLKTLGVDGGGVPLGTEWAVLNCGEISDIADLYVSKTFADANYIKRVLDDGERGFFLYGDANNTVKEGFMFTNPDTGIMGIHAYRLTGSTVEQYGFQLDKDGLPYWLFADGSRKRILTTNDSVGGGGTTLTYTLAEPLYFVGSQINVRTASSTQTGVLTNTKFVEFDAKLGQGSTVNTYLNFADNKPLYFGYISQSEYAGRFYYNPNTLNQNPIIELDCGVSNIRLYTNGLNKNVELTSVNGDVKFSGKKYYFQNGIIADIEIDMSGFAIGKVLKATSNTKAEWVTP